MVFDRGREVGFSPYLITLNAAIGRALVAQEVLAIATVQVGADNKWLEDPAAVRVAMALTLGRGEGGVLADGRLGEALPLE